MLDRGPAVTTPRRPPAVRVGSSTTDEAVIIERHDLRRSDGRRLLVYGELRGDLEGDTIGPVDLPALHQRHDALTDGWVAVSPARNTRPNSALDARTTGQRTCPLCPGGPEVPFSYEAAVFENRWPSFLADPPPVPDRPDMAPSRGRCEVVLYTEEHDRSLTDLDGGSLARVVAMWRDRTGELWADPAHAFVMAFENRGATVGATISHPHGQIYAFDRLPPFVRPRVAALAAHRDRTGACLGCSIVATDTAAADRTVATNEHFTVTVPFAARWPYEVHVRARRHGLRRLTDLEPAEQVALTRLLREIVARYDGLFGFELPYMMSFQEAPVGAPDWHLSLEFAPPHRSAELTKIRASVETFTGLFINDTLPESSAARLAAIPVRPTVEQSVPSTVVAGGSPRA
jgi:UDPglucose--hexose-1-phosphate uridylyltransferase